MLQSLVEERIGDAENYPRNGVGVAGGKLLEICVVYCVEGPIICHEPKGVNQGRDGLNVYMYMFTTRVMQTKKILGKSYIGGGGGVNHTVPLSSLEEMRREINLPEQSPSTERAMGRERRGAPQ